jgi:hypothetical protein
VLAIGRLGAGAGDVRGEQLGIVGSRRLGLRVEGGIEDSEMGNEA